MFLSILSYAWIVFWILIWGNTTQQVETRLQNRGTMLGKNVCDYFKLIVASSR